MGIFTAISAGLGIIGGIFNIGSQMKSAALQRDQMRKQQDYNAKVAEDVRRKGEAEKEQLRIAGARDIDLLEYSASQSGIAMDGTASDIREESQLNIERDVETLEADIQAMVEAAKFSGETQYLNMQTQLSNTQGDIFGNVLGLAKVGVNVAEDISGYDTFLDWLTG